MQGSHLDFPVKPSSQAIQECLRSAYKKEIM